MNSTSLYDDYLNKKSIPIAAVFDGDIRKYNGYQYTQKKLYSMEVANSRLTRETALHIPKSTQTVIDMGCGDGVYTHALSIQFPHVRFSGFDPSVEAVRIAKKRYSNIQFYPGDLFLLSAPKKKYDVAILRGVIHHVHDPAMALQKARLWARTIIIIEPNGNNILLKLIEKVSPYHRLHQERSYSGMQLKNWCAQAKIRLVKEKYVGFVPFFFPTVLARIVYLLQPYLEKIFVLSYFFAAQIVLVGED
ncbi:class I SAM-dependent methyltransferase [Candidatus Roizmanbacteria bacterium CG10_big_fil_rev_8_21_14_0_10_39_6]|uniref:Class I SAM-dependent methyltransferase n=1 Tax=Candidatus Roizmanbacteria bacterium CG10_big_fil_rev_8_21_14_0_10_39_6 TaxID=1974853 RepID=A0A2M8KTS3_9BACT|nr:MAG: class I SAM-dependent methyltransferase [Candidatus Roizmanbacteria bacterium CG10_big_fil_rev_8_21_14_0_10_39_6]